MGVLVSLTGKGSGAFSCSTGGHFLTTGALEGAGIEGWAVCWA